MGMNHCKACNTTFVSITSFDMHRIGDFEMPIYRVKKDSTPTRDVIGYKPSTRRCMTQDEIIAAGMVQNDKGWWGTGVVLDFLRKGNQDKQDHDEPEEETA